MTAGLRRLFAGTGFGWFAAVSLFLTTVALAFADQWLLAAAAGYGPAYLAGRWDRGRTAVELAAVKARERRLDDELNDIHRNGLRVGQPHNGAGHLSPAALLDRNSNTTAAATGGVPAQVRATTLP